MGPFLSKQHIIRETHSCIIHSTECVQTSDCFFPQLYPIDVNKKDNLFDPVVETLTKNIYNFQTF